MKRILALVLAILSFACACSSAAEGTPTANEVSGLIEEHLYAEFNGAGNDYFCASDSDSSFAVYWISADAEEAAALALDEPYASSWHDVKCDAYNRYLSVRSLLDAYGCEDSGLTLAIGSYAANDETPNTIDPYYVIGDYTASQRRFDECVVLLDTITKDTELTRTDSDGEKQSKSASADDTLVWVSTHGKRYHRKSSCSNMKEPVQVTLSQAKERGLTPCKKCY